MSYPLSIYHFFFPLLQGPTRKPASSRDHPYCILSDALLRVSQKTKKRSTTAIISIFKARASRDARPRYAGSGRLCRSAEFSIDQQNTNRKQLEPATAKSVTPRFKGKSTTTARVFDARCLMSDMLMIHFLCLDSVFSSNSAHSHHPDRRIKHIQTGIKAKQCGCISPRLTQELGIQRESSATQHRRT